jgi:polyisoprenoid-binding protein YceI
MRCLAIALALVPALLQPRPASAQQPNLDFTVSGTSTIRGWTCTVKGATTVTPSSGSAKPAPGFPNGVQTATVTVQVKNFQCPEEEMKQHLMDAMKPDKFPEIVYKLDKYEVAGAQTQATGSITIGGVTAPIVFPVSLKAAADGVQIEGDTRLDMTKFGIDPPVVMLGMLKVGPQIRIAFKGVIPAR